MTKFRIPRIPLLTRIIPLASSDFYVDNNQIVLILGPLEMPAATFSSAEEAERIYRDLKKCAG